MNEISRNKSNKVVKDLYTEDYEILMREIEDDTYKWKAVHQLEELILLKWPYYPRQSADSVEFLSNTKGIFHRTRTNNTHLFFMETQILQITKNILRRTKLKISHLLISNYAIKL